MAARAAALSGVQTTIRVPGALCTAKLVEVISRRG